jgi:hypothetical protein
VRRLQARTKCLLGLWIVFVLLVAFGVHGSSTGVTAMWWSPEKPYSGYLFNTERKPGSNESNALATLLMANARPIRWDELMVATPLALSQLTHHPRFPVVNTNIGNGQNVLISPHVPVWHIATLARPATWGYFFLGAQRGLAWYWWFEVFSCFTVLYLLLEIALRKHNGLAAFGAFWFCASAYVICWSLWPAHITFFPVLACVAAYHLLSSDRLGVQVLCAFLLAIGMAGFVMFLYPPWQVSLGYLIAFAFAGLFVRDQLFVTARRMLGQRLVLVAAALLLASALVAAYLVTCWSDLKVMANTEYPGLRVSTGGDYSFAKIFKGLYNLSTIYTAQPALVNESESASFYYLFPAVLVALCLSSVWRRRLGIFGWLLVTYLLGVLFFALVGIPEFVATHTFLSYVPPYRADVGLGLASVVLCTYVLALRKDVSQETETMWSRAVIYISVASAVCLFMVHGLSLQRLTGGFPSIYFVGIASVVAGLLSYLMLQGRAIVFCTLLGIIVVATTAVFNPLSTNLDHIYDSELADQIVKFDQLSGDHPVWICYGGMFPSVLVTVLGGRTISGIQWPPQLSLWKTLDPTGGAYEKIYNRFAEVTLEYQPDTRWVFFNHPTDGTMTVVISPDHPRLKEIGARYVLAMDEVQNKIDAEHLPLLYKSRNGRFSIYSIAGSGSSESTVTSFGSQK